MTHLSRILVPALLAMALIQPAFTVGEARAEAGVAAAAKPLVVIRFNQDRIYFDQQLYSAISQAVAVKPDLMVDIVSLAPATGSATLDSQWQTTASRNTQTVVASLQNMGVPLSRIKVTGQAQSGLRYDETRVFVR